MWTLAAILTVVTTVAVDSQQAPYALLCTNHTMVIYPGVGSLCLSGGSPYSSGVSQADKDLIVEVHNTLRSRVAQGNEIRGNPGPQPPATDMKMLVWDEELAIIAQRWAYQCTFKHDKCRRVERFYVGQCLYRSLSPENKTIGNWTRAINKWYDEVDFFNPANISPFVFNSKTSHYTQLAWANTGFIGCAFIFYKSSLPTEATYPFVHYYVCNYGQGGNYLAGKMYTNGTACTQCPTGKNCVNKLCA